MGSWATKPGPDVALRYWALKEGATMRDVVLQVKPSSQSKALAESSTQ